MQWIRDIALFLVFSGILLEIISDTKYYKFAKWVAGTILLLQFVKPFSDTDNFGNRLFSGVLSLDYALGTDRVLEEIYETDEWTEGSVLMSYKKKISEQIDVMLRKNGLRLFRADMSVAEDGGLQELYVLAVYEDRAQVTEILIPTVMPVRLKEEQKNNAVSPMELYIRKLLAEFYGIDENRVEVIIQEA